MKASIDLTWAFHVSLQILLGFATSMASVGLHEATSEALSLRIYLLDSNSLVNVIQRQVE